MRQCFIGLVVLLVGLLGCMSSGSQASAVILGPGHEYVWQLATDHAAWPAEHFFKNLFSFQDRLWLIDEHIGSWVSDDGTNWVSIKSLLPLKGIWLPMVVFDDELFAINPSNISGQTRVWVSEDGQAWSSISTNLNIGGDDISGFRSVVFQDQIWLIHGEREEIWTSSNGRQWSQLNIQLPWAPRFHYNIEVLNNRLWVIGGRISQDGQYTALDDVWTSDDGINWTQTSTHSPWGTDRIFYATAAYDGFVWLMGGYDELGTPGRNDVWLSSDGVNWHQAPDATWPARSAFNAVIFENHLVILGGKTGADKFLNDVWMMKSDHHP